MILHHKRYWHTGCTRYLAMGKDRIFLEYLLHGYPTSVLNTNFLHIHSELKTDPAKKGR